MNDGPRADQVFDRRSERLLFLPPFSRGNDTDAGSVSPQNARKGRCVPEATRECRRIAGRQGERRPVGRGQDQGGAGGYAYQGRRGERISASFEFPGGVGQQRVTRSGIGRRRMVLRTVRVDQCAIARHDVYAGGKRQDVDDDHGPAAGQQFLKPFLAPLASDIERTLVKIHGNLPFRTARIARTARTVRVPWIARTARTARTARVPWIARTARGRTCSADSAGAHLQRGQLGTAGQAPDCSSRGILRK